MKYSSGVASSGFALGHCTAVSGCWALGEMICICMRKAKTTYLFPGVPQRGAVPGVELPLLTAKDLRGVTSSPKPTSYLENLVFLGCSPKSQMKACWSQRDLRICRGFNFLSANLIQSQQRDSVLGYSHCPFEECFGGQEELASRQEAGPYEESMGSTDLITPEDFMKCSHRARSLRAAVRRMCTQYALMWSAHPILQVDINIYLKAIFFSGTGRIMLYPWIRSLTRKGAAFS